MFWFYQQINEKALPAYHDTTDECSRITINSMNDVDPSFDANRMADEYYKKICE